MLATSSQQSPAFMEYYSEEPLPSPSFPRSARRPSFTQAMSWRPKHMLSASRSSAQPHPSSLSHDPLEISEPSSTIEGFNNAPIQRMGKLGAGATVVRTPQEALAGSVIVISNTNTTSSTNTKRKSYETTGSRDSEKPFPPQSPPLPPIPMIPETEPTKAYRHVRNVSASASASASTSAAQIPLPPTPNASPQRATLKIRSPQPEETFPPVPPVPAFLTSAPPQPPFEALLLSSLPSDLHQLDPRKVLVSLETSTETHKTTLATITSRQSHLSKYVASLVMSTRENEGDDDEKSFYSQRTEVERDGDPDDDSQETDADSAVNSIFRNHLVSAGLIPVRHSTRRRTDAKAHLHIFLDRPSEPYSFLLKYLRTPPSSSSTRSSQLPFLRIPSSTRIDALLDLRDEALYLGLIDLHKLCLDELAPAPRQRVRHSRTDSSTISRSIANSESQRERDSSSSVRGESVSGRALPQAPPQQPPPQSQPPPPPPPQSQSQSQSQSRRDRREVDSAPATAKEFPPINLSGLQLRLSQERSRSKDRGGDGTARNRPAGDWI
ncbi:hypothetical protein BD410DRAFT_833987 [Rickenella mellea]|uniref:BTB domain-containing protein n=1 Tax=Rickenella mellea TaxID=50990 RepID=A0A4R5XHI5_9AGAM|nr:hypothetical protein BD410DRAFT_833987 [Rickenella mellea]